MSKPDHGVQLETLPQIQEEKHALMKFQIAEHVWLMGRLARPSKLLRTTSMAGTLITKFPVTLYKDRHLLGYSLTIGGVG